MRKEALERGDADDASTLGLPKRAAPKRELKASVITIAMGGATHLKNDDRDKKMDLVGRLAKVYGEDAVRDNARLAPGVVAMDWPKDEKTPSTRSGPSASSSAATAPRWRPSPGSTTSLTATRTAE